MRLLYNYLASTWLPTTHKPTCLGHLLLLRSSNNKVLMGLFVIDLTHRLAEHAGRSTIKYIFILLNHGGTSIREGSINRDNAG